MEDEVVQLNTKCRKIIEDPDKMDDLPELLEILEQFPMSPEALTKSRIGMTLNELRKKIVDDKLSKRAKALIRKWKNVLEEAPKKDSPSNGSSVKKSLSTEGKKQSNVKKSPTPTSDDNESSSEKTPTPKFNNHLNFHKRVLPKDEVRNKNIELLLKSLRSEELPEHTQDPEEVAARIEAALYDRHGGTTPDYYSAVRTRVFNLRDKKNPALRENMLTGAVSADRLAQMTTAEMASEEMKKQREAFTKEAINEHQMAVQEGTPSEMFKCGKCGGKNCTYNQMQTRSADEPMTTFVFCRTCGNRWKFC